MTLNVNMVFYDCIRWKKYSHYLEMDRDWIDERDHAKRYFKNKFPKYRFLAEDFAQWYVMKILEGRDMKPDFFFRHALDFLKPIHKHHKSLVDVEYKDIMRPAPEFHSEIQTAINQLEGRDRIVFTLCYKWDMTNIEIGEIIGMKPNAISQILFNAKNKIKKANRYN